MCADCDKSARTYNIHCAGCCARLVRAARPSRKRQVAMLDALARMGSKVPRAEVLEQLQVQS